jgi:16S rRNA (guanine527-N7)-methyltransferase
MRGSPFVGLVTLALLTLPLARRGGLVLLIKGQRAEEEFEEARTVIDRQNAVHEQTIATTTGRIVVLRKR